MGRLSSALQKCEDFGDRGLEDVPRIRAFETLLDRRVQAAPPRPKPKRVKRASGKKRKNRAASSQSVEKVQGRPSDKLENLHLRRVRRRPKLGSSIERASTVLFKRQS